ncbi:hypothetical protein HDU98_010838, partial [Podochytrium sp. JEL0797]
MPKQDLSPFKVVAEGTGAAVPSVPAPVSIQTAAGVITNAGSVSAARAKQPTQWAAFSYRDSLRIEEKYQLMLASPVPLPADSPIHKVLVNEDLLYEVDVAKKEVYPVYWHGPTFHVQRGTWFVSPDNSNSKFIPCDDNLSKQLEDGYKKFKPWLAPSSSSSSSPNSTSASSTTITSPPPPSTAPVPATSPPIMSISPSSTSTTSDKPPLAAPPATPHIPSLSSYKPDQKWALFGPYMNSHAIYTEKRGALIVSDQLSSKLARAVMSQITRSSDPTGTKVWRGWDECERVMMKKDAAGKDAKVAKRGSNAGLEGETSGATGGSIGSLDGDNSGNPLSAKPSKESLVGLSASEREEEKWKDEEGGGGAQDRQIDHLVLVIHGVGQKLGERVETVDFAKDCTTLRQTLKQSSKLYFTPGVVPPAAPSSTPTLAPSAMSASTGSIPVPVSGKEKVRASATAAAPAASSSSSSRRPVLQNMPEHGGVQILPVQWRQKIEFGKRKEATVSSKKSGGGGVEGEDEDERREREEEEARRKEREVHIDDITLDGVQSIRYLVSDIVLDVLLYMTPKYRQEMVNHVVDEMNRIYDAYKLRNPTFNGKVSLYGHSLGSLLAFDILCNQQPHRDPTTASSQTATPFPPRMQSEMDLSDIMHRNESGGNTATPAADRRFNGLMEHTQIQYKPLHFEVDKFFGVGSPVGLFLLLKGNKLVGRSMLPDCGEGGIVEEGQHVSSPACNAVYNVFHPHDPVAYRFEPIAAKSMAKEKPVQIQYNKGGLRGAVVGLGELGAGVMRSGFGFFGGLFACGGGG